MKPIVLHIVVWVCILAIEGIIYYFGFSKYFFVVIGPLFIGLLLSDAIRIHEQNKKSPHG